MNERDTARDAARERQTRRTLGPDAACVVCGEDDPSLLESHHVAGWRNDGGLEGPLCFNDHRRVTEMLRAGGVSMAHPKSPLDRLAALLGGLAELLLLVAGRLKGWSEWLHRLMAALDEAFPEWRALMASIPAPVVFGTVQR